VGREYASVLGRRLHLQAADTWLLFLERVAFPWIIKANLQQKTLIENYFLKILFWQ
jgi:hypothetical protein